MTRIRDRKIWTCDDNCPILLTLGDMDRTVVMRLREFEYHDVQFFISFVSPFEFSQNDNVKNDVNVHFVDSILYNFMVADDLTLGTITISLESSINPKFMDNISYATHMVQVSVTKMTNDWIYLDSKSSTDTVLYRDMMFPKKLQNGARLRNRHG